MPINAVLNFYKPPGMTSAQAVGFIKGLTGEKVGHAGTLDPEAAGVLPILIGKATKISDYLMDSEKQYLTEIAFGAATDTQDAQGLVIQTGSNYPDMSSLREVVNNQFIGDIMQLPPQYSALKVHGKTAYQLAREGKTADLKERVVRFDEITILSETENHGFLMRVRCGKGAYIRTLCHDLGSALDCPAHMRFLLREKSAGLHICKSIIPQEIREWSLSKKEDRSLFLKPEYVLRHLPFAEIPEPLWFKAINGVALPVNAVSEQRFDNNTEVCLTIQNELFGIYSVSEDFFRIRVMLGFECDQKILKKH